MRLVPSPTSRLMITAALAGLAATFVMSAPAHAAGPSAPGDFTGYGFDACVAPSQTVMDAWNLRSPYSAIGIYVSGSSRYCGDKYQPNLSRSWVARNAANGWRFMPIHVGRQASCFVNNPRSRVQKKKMSSDFATARAQARQDAAEAVAALRKYGFGAGSATYLDIEWYARTNKTCNSAVIHFVDEWTESVQEAGFKAGLYSSGSAAIQAVDAVRNRDWFHPPDHMWIAWTNNVANTDGGPYLSDSGWTHHQRLHQYLNGVDVTYGGHTLNIDKDYLDVGKGSVAVTQTLPCGVRMSFDRYPTLKLGDKRAEVATLECLLKRQGLAKTVDGYLNAGMVRAIDLFRARLGWAPTGHTTPATWTALLAAGPAPRVLKQGSVGEPVWRLQRSLVAAGESLRISGVYDAKTVAAVKAYRKSHGLTRYATTESSVWTLLERGKTAG